MKKRKGTESEEIRAIGCDSEEIPEAEDKDSSQPTSEERPLFSLKRKP